MASASPDHPAAGRVLSFRALFLFRAVRQGKVQPQVVPRGSEWLELILDGRVHPPADSDDRVLAGPGTLFWHLPGESTVHRHPPTEPYVCLAAIFDTVAMAGRPAPRRSCWSDVHAARGFAEEAQQALQSGSWREPVFAAYAYHRLQWVAFHHQRTAERPMPAALIKVLDLINRRLEDGLSLALLARTAGCSVSCLCDLFRRHLGATPHDHITSQRLARAKSLLTNSGMLTKEVARACGFGTASQFCRVFRRLVGVTPQDYRGRRLDG